MLLPLLILSLFVFHSHTFAATEALTVPRPTNRALIAHIIAASHIQTQQPGSLSTNNTLSNSDQSSSIIFRPSYIQHSPPPQLVPVQRTHTLHDLFVHNNTTSSLGVSFSVDNTRSTQNSTQPLTATRLSEQQAELNALNLTPAEFASLKKHTSQEWYEVIQNHLKQANEIRQGQDIQSHPSLEKADQDFFVRLHGLYAFEGFREAIKKLSYYDTLIAEYNRDIASDPELQSQINLASHKASQLGDTVVGRLVHAVYDKNHIKFNIVEYLQQETAMAQQRIDSAWAAAQNTFCKEHFCADAQPKLEQQCSTFETLITDHAQQLANPTLKQRYLELLQMIKNMRMALPNACNSTNTHEYRYAVSRDLQIGLKLLPRYSDFSFPQPPYDLLHLGHFVGKPALQIAYSKGMAAIEHAGNLYIRAEQLADPINKQRVKQLAMYLAQQGAIACQNIQDGDLSQGFQALQRCLEVQAQAEAIQAGVFNYAQAFSPQAMQDLEQHISMLRPPYKDCVKMEHQTTCPELCTEQVQHHQQRMLNKQALWAERIDLARDRVSAGNHTLTTQHHEFNAQEQQFLLQNNISPLSLMEHTGNSVQQQARLEVVTMIRQAVVLQVQHPVNATVVHATKLVGQLSQQALDAISHGNLIHALDLLNINNALLDMASATALLPQHHQPTLLEFALKGIPHVPQMAQALVHGTGEGIVQAVKSAHYIATHKVEVGLAITNLLIKIGDTLLVHDDSPYNLAARPLSERIATSKANIESLTVMLRDLAEHLVNSTPEERAYTAGEFVGNCIIFDGTLRTLTTSVRVLDRALPLLKAHAQETLTTNFIAARNALTTAIGTQELEAFNFIKQAQAAGTAIKVPMVHFNEQFMQKMEAEAARNVNKNAKVVATEQVTETTTTAVRHVPQSINVTEALKNIPATCAGLDASVGNIAKLEKALEAFKELPGAQSPDSPITKLIQNGKLGAEIGHLGTARGAAYELEKAYDLMQQGKKIDGFGKKLRNAFAKKEFDIIAGNELFECKNIDWTKCTTKEIDDFISAASQQAKIAKDLNMNFTYCSKHNLLDNMKAKFREFNIAFIEG
jgi:hypothetical protein